MLEGKERIDVLLVEKGFFDSREKARKSLMAGLIFVDNIRVDKPGEKVKRYANIEVKGDTMPYVSRGGLKLEKAISEFGLNLDNKVAMDVGASTGGFTDCMLKNKASKVFAVDVGYGQMAWTLRTDPRVICMERTNIRYVKPEDIGEKLDFASIDVSFISLKLVLPVVKNLLKIHGEIIALIKPQFEAGREKVGKKGVVRNSEVHLEVVQGIVSYACGIGLMLNGVTFSPIKGPEGNIEYLAHFKNIGDRCELSQAQLELIENVVESSHKSLRN
jgi:23S rRNA (cytidine1920-2'-O)/16S rRNA (cytidine1409-2'-O)-methyltransferase